MGLIPTESLSPAARQGPCGRFGLNCSAWRQPGVHVPWLCFMEKSQWTWTWPPCPLADCKEGVPGAIGTEGPGQGKAVAAAYQPNCFFHGQ